MQQWAISVTAVWSRSHLCRIQISPIPFHSQFWWLKWQTIIAFSKAFPFLTHADDISVGSESFDRYFRPKGVLFSHTLTLSFWVGTKSLDRYFRQARCSVLPYTDGIILSRLWEFRPLFPSRTVFHFLPHTDAIWVGSENLDHYFRLERCSISPTHWCHHFESAQRV